MIEKNQWSKNLAAPPISGLTAKLIHPLISPSTAEEALKGVVVGGVQEEAGLIHPVAECDNQ